MVPSTDTIFGITSKKLCGDIHWIVSQLHRFTSDVASDFEFPAGSGMEIAVDARREVNASAYWHEESATYFVTFSIGLCIWAYSLAVDMCLADQRDFTESPETRPLGTFEFRRATPLQELARRVAELDGILPPEQHGFCQHMFGMVLKTVFFHELAHIVRGHVDHVRALNLSPTGMIDELDLRADKSDDALNRIYRTLEYEADQYAALMATEKVLDAPQSFERWQTLTPKQNLAVLIWSFALFCTALEEDDLQVGNRSPSYPTPFLRLVVFGSTVENVIRNRPEHKLDYASVVADAFKMVAVFADRYPALDELRRLMDEDAQETLADEELDITDDLIEQEAERASFRFRRRADGVR